MSYKTSFLSSDYKPKSKPGSSVSYTSPVTYTSSHNSGFTSHGSISAVSGRGGIVGTTSVSASHHGPNHSITGSISRSGPTLGLGKGSNTFSGGIRLKL